MGMRLHLVGFELPNGNKGVVMAYDHRDAKERVATYCDLVPDQVETIEAEELVDDQYNGIGFLTTESE